MRSHGVDPVNVNVYLIFLSSVSSHGGLVVEHLLHKKCHSATVDQIPLGTMIIIMKWL